MGTALLAGEHAAIHFGGDVAAVGDDHRAARTRQRLVGREADHVGDADRRRIDPGDHQPGDVGDVRHQVSADLVSDVAELLPIGRERVAGVPGDDDLGLMLARQSADRVVVEQFGFRIDAVANGVVLLAAARDRAAVRQVTALQQIQPHDGVADVDQAAEDGAVGRRAGERLDVDEQLLGGVFRRGEQLGGASTRQRLDHVGVFGALVIALVGVTAVLRQTCVVVEDFRLGHRPRLVERIALGVDVVERRRQRLAHGVGHGALRRDQDQGAFLSRRLVTDQFGDVRVKLGKVAPKQVIIVSRHRCSILCLGCGIPTILTDPPPCCERRYNGGYSLLTPPPTLPRFQGGERTQSNCLVFVGLTSD